MIWALINVVTITLQVQDEKGQPQFIEAAPGTICNIINYSGAPYTPPVNFRLIEVPDDAKIGDTGY